MRMLTILLNILRSTFRSRAAVELENFALRHQVNVLKRRPVCCGSSYREFGVTGARLLPSSNPKPSSPGIAKAFACSGHGEFDAVNRADLPSAARSVI